MNTASYQMAVEAMASVDVAVARAATVAELQHLSHDAQPWPISGDHIARANKIERCKRMNPDCRDGKHTACHGDGWDFEHDTFAACPCECHAPG